MEYKNNWPEYIQGKKHSVKSEVDGSVASGVCVGGKANNKKVSKLAIALARAECNKTAKVEGSTLQIDQLMSKLVYLQRSSDLNRACMARKAAAELATVRKNLSFLCNVLKKNNARDLKTVMTRENRKALALFHSRWSNLLGV